MYFVYIDESGDPGYLIKNKSCTEAYTLSALIVRDRDWLQGLNGLIAFRKFLNRRYGIKMGDELKAHYLISNSGPFVNLNLSKQTRMKIYKKALLLQQKLGIFRSWAIIIDKRKWELNNYKLGILEGAWTDMIERLERFTTSADEPCIVFPDEGNNRIITGALRRLRRFSRPNSKYGNVTLARNANMVLEDPNFRVSHESYYVQFADLNAYAATRSAFPRSWFGNQYWEYLGNSRDEHVNALQEAQEELH